MTSPSVNYDPASIRHYVSKKPPEDFNIDRDPIDDSEIKPEPPAKPRKPLPPGVRDDKLFIKRAKALIERHKPKGRG